MAEAPAPEGDELERLRVELEEAKARAQDNFALLQRAQADFLNYKRRVEQEREERAKFGKTDLVLKILPVLDDFERALKAVPEEQRKADWVQGMALIERKLRTALESEGVTRIEALGKPFDPWEHEAVLHQEDGRAPEGSVISVFREGYRLYDRVIRPSQVVVAKRPGS